MAAPSKDSLTAAIVGGCVSLIGALIFAALTGAWGGKESASDHRNDILTLRADIRRLKDVVCLDHPRAPQCESVSQP